MIIPPTQVKFPKGLEHLKLFYDVNTYDQMKAKLDGGTNIQIGLDSEPSFVLVAIIAGIAFYNDDDETYKRFVKEMGVKIEHGHSEIFSRLVTWIYGIPELIEMLWDQDDFSLNKNFFRAMTDADDEYVSVIINNPKFLEELNMYSSDTTIITWFAESDNLLKGVLNDSRYQEILFTMYETTNHEVFLSKSVKDIFIF